MSSYAAELVDLKPDVIVAAATPALAAIAQETPSIPIVFVNVADPVGQGFVPNFARPGGNITGFTSFEFSMGGKWVETIHEIRPSGAAVIFNPATAPYFPFFLHSIQTAASSFQIWIDVSPVHNTADVERTVRHLASDACLIVVPSTFMTTHRELVIGLAAKRNIPAIYGFGYYARDGGLVSYGFDVRDIFMRAASYVDRILRGTRPADLPVQVPTKYERVASAPSSERDGYGAHHVCISFGSVPRQGLNGLLFATDRGWTRW
jgi:putative tryptophan/tyrosine transport system substrate-binding protein